MWVIFNTRSGEPITAGPTGLWCRRQLDGLWPEGWTARGASSGAEIRVGRRANEAFIATGPEGALDPREVLCAQEADPVIARILPDGSGSFAPAPEPPVPVVAYATVCADNDCVWAEHRGPCAPWREAAKAIEATR